MSRNVASSTNFDQINLLKNTKIHAGDVVGFLCLRQIKPFHWISLDEQ
jgi:hypothetical protein